MSSSMIRPFFVSLTLFGLLLSVRVWGYEFTHLTKDNNGLSYDGISAIMQDSRGFIWIGTYKGLNRYDGNTFKVYGMLEMGLDSDFVYSIVEDSEGNLWIGTDKGVCMYSYRQDRFVPLRTVSSEGSVITNKVTFITVEPDGRVWMLVNDQGCFAYDIHRGELHEWPYRKIGFSGFRKMLRCVDGDVWISRYHSNLYHADSSFREVHPVVLGDQSDFFEDDEIEGLFYAPDGSLLVASMKRGLSEVDLVAKRVEVLLALPANSLLQHAFLENNRNVWLSTSKGVWRYDLLTGESLCLRNDEMDKFSLSNDYTTCTFVDKDGGLWVGTKDAGVNYSGPSQNNFEKQYLADGESLENVLVSGFAEDEAGRIWVATEEKGLLVYDPQAHRTSKYRLEGILSRICSICYDDGYLWFGTRVGLFRLDIAANRLKVYGVLKRVQGVNDPNVYMIYKTSDGEIFVGTTLGLFRYERSSDSFLEIPAFDGIFTTSAVEDPLHPGVVWFSSYANGVYCWDSISDKLVNYDASSGCGLTNDKICSIFIDHKARIWAVGFSIGVAMFDRESGRFTVYDRRNVQALTSDVFFKALEDKAGNLRLASDRALWSSIPRSAADMSIPVSMVCWIRSLRTAPSGAPPETCTSDPTMASSDSIPKRCRELRTFPPWCCPPCRSATMKPGLRRTSISCRRFRSIAKTIRSGSIFRCSGFRLPSRTRFSVCWRGMRAPGGTLPLRNRSFIIMYLPGSTGFGYGLSPMRSGWRYGRRL